MSEQTEPVKVRQKPGPKPKLPKVSVLERRLRNPFSGSTVPVTLKSPGPWEVRWVYANLRPGRLYDMVHNKGWEFITPEELDGSPDEYGLTAKDNRLVRGDHGEEVLMKMPKAMFDQIQARKNEVNVKGLGQQKMRDSVAQATASEHGPEAGDAVYNAFQHGSVKDSRGALDEEA